MSLQEPCVTEITALFVFQSSFVSIKNQFLIQHTLILFLQYILSTQAILLKIKKKDLKLTSKYIYPILSCFGISYSWQHCPFTYEFVQLLPFRLKFSTPGICLSLIFLTKVFHPRMSLNENKRGEMFHFFPMLQIF